MPPGSGLIDMKPLLTLTAIIEATTGAALIAAPILVVRLLLGSNIAEAAIPLGRIAGAALFALGVACWQSRGDQSPRGLAIAMLVYNVGAVVILACAGVQFPNAGGLLWVVVALHAAMAIWCSTLLRLRAA